MVVDSSALVAIVLKEPDFEFYIDRISSAVSRRISSASLLETSIVVNGKGRLHRRASPTGTGS